MQDEDQVKKGMSKSVKTINEDPLWNLFIDACSDELKCPITNEPFIDPWSTMDGHTFEKIKIEAWLKGHNTCPSCNRVLENKTLIPNFIAKNLVVAAFEKFKAKEGEEKKAAKEPEPKKAEKNPDDVNGFVTSDSDLITFINTFKQISKAFRNDEFKAQVLENNLIAQILFEKRQIFLLLQLVNKEWKEGYQLSDKFIEAVNKLIVSFIKRHFTPEGITEELSHFHIKDINSDVMKNLLPKPIVAEKKPQPSLQPNPQFWAPQININQESENLSVNKGCDYKFKFILLGDSGVGQTSLIHRYVKDNFIEHSYETYGYKSPTFETRYIQVGEKQVHTTIWDMNGRESYERNSGCFRGADVIFLVFDLTDRSSLDSIREYWYDQLDRFYASSKCIILVGTKADLMAERAIEEEKIKAVVQELALVDGFVITSAKSGWQVENIFKEASEKLIKHMEEKKQPAEEKWLPSVSLEEEKKPSCTLM